MPADQHQPHAPFELPGHEDDAWFQGLCEARMHEIFNRWIAEDQADLSHRIGVLAGVGGGLALCATAAALRLSINTPIWVVILLALVGIVIVAVFGTRAGRRRDRSLNDFMTQHVDDEGVFMICLQCEYALRGCVPPRRRCPECGTEAVRVDREHGRWVFRLNPTQDPTQTPEPN